MGLDINLARFLMAAHRRGASFAQVLTLGRLILNVYPARMSKLLRRHGYPDDHLRAHPEEWNTADPFFQTLGAQQVSSMDASDFEGANFVHDLNLPVPLELKQRFDVVCDGGTLEHVFNFPVALQNCMEMVRVGGRVFIHNCANNLCGHGFYQFSPELFFRAFSPENGFAVERMVMHVVGPYGRWYEVTDPGGLGERVELITFTPIHILVQAKRTRPATIFAQAPQQSDYAVMWKEDKKEPGRAAPPPPAAATAAPRLSRKFPGLARLLHVVRSGLIFYHRHSFRNKRFFRPVGKED
jgi:hypothetical protein